MDGVVDGKRLQHLREARGWNKQRLAREAGIHPSVVSRLERDIQNNLDAAVLVALATALNTRVDALLTVPAYEREEPLSPDLAAEVSALGTLSVAQQQHVAAILHAYRTTYPKESSNIPA